jgi:hypothetical protein
MIMHSLFRRLTPLWLAVALASPAAMIGCQPQQTAPQPTTVTDYGDYGQWEHETHRDHQDLSKRSPDEQKQYSDWHNNNHH